MPKQSVIEAKNSIDIATAQQLKEMSPEEFMIFIDRPINKTTNNTPKNIWKLALYPILNRDKKIFLMDYLGGLAQVDMIPKFIE